MQSIWFWKDWSAAERNIFWVLTTLVILIISLFCFVYFQFPSLAFIYNQFQELELVEITLRNFDVGPSSIGVPADNLLLFETFAGSELQPTSWIYYVFLFCLTIGFIVFLSFVTTLKRFAFLAGIGLSILILANFHWESIVLFGLTNKATALVVISIYASIAYYFQSYGTHYRFNFRLLVFGAITLVLALIVVLASQVTNPFLHLAVNGLTTGIIMSIVFILMISHEITALFITIVTNSQKPTKSAAHYYIISAIYLANLLITYLIRERYIYWDIFTVNSYLLLTFSAIIGLWGVRKRESLYADSVTVFSTVTYLYLGFFLITFATVSFCFTTHSTTMMEGFNDIILFTHLAYGIIFTAYVTANFGPMLLANLPVHKILYKPSTMPFFTFRIMSLIATFAFLSFSSPLTSYFARATAAYYNAYGDVYQMQGDAITAKAYYNKSISSRNRNHHAHYALATMYASQLDPEHELKEYNNIINSTPSEITFLNYSDSYQTNDNFRAAADLLTAGLRIFPSSGVLLNAQALNYYNLNLLDSSMLYFQKARKNSFTKEAAEANLFATSALLKLKFPADSLLTLLGSTEIGAQSNAFALANIQHLPLEIKIPLTKDTVLTVGIAALISNQLINQHNKIDTALLAPILSLAKKPCNATFKEYIFLAVAHAYYTSGLVSKAFELLRELAFSTGQGKYFHLLGIWLLEQHNPSTAALYFKTAEEKKINSAAFLQALAWTEADSMARARPLWDSLTTTKNAQANSEAQFYSKIMDLKKLDVLQQPDALKYGYCRYRIPLTDSILFHEVTTSIKDEPLRIRAILDRSKNWLLHDDPMSAIRCLSILKGTTLRDKALADDILVINLMLAAEISDWSFIQNKLNQELPVGFEIEKIYWQALLDVQDGKTADATRKFNYLAIANFQFEEVMLMTAKYFFKNESDKMKPYSILVNGLLAKPNSIKLLKEYVYQSTLLGFESESVQAMAKLKKLLSPTAYQKFEREGIMPIKY